MNSHTIDLRRCISHAYSKAAFWDRCSIWLAVAAFLVGLARAYLGFPEPWASLCMIGIGAGAFFARLRQTHHRGKAEKLKRHHEYVDGLGLPVSGMMLADYRAPVSDKDLARFDATLQGSQFASDAPVGPRRLLEHVEESAWFSEKLSSLAGWITLAIVFIASGLAFAVLYVVGATPGSSPEWIQVAGSAVLFLITGGMITRCVRYFSFASSARECVRTVQSNLGAQDLSEAAAIPIAAEYQVQRAGAPQIPSILWTIRHEHLNKLWASRRKIP